MAGVIWILSTFQMGCFLIESLFFSVLFICGVLGEVPRYECCETEKMCFNCVTGGNWLFKPLLIIVQKLRRVQCSVKPFVNNFSVEPECNCLFERFIWTSTSKEHKVFFYDILDFSNKMCLPLDVICFCRYWMNTSMDILKFCPNKVWFQYTHKHFSWTNQQQFVVFLHQWTWNQSFVMVTMFSVDDWLLISSLLVVWGSSHTGLVGGRLAEGGIRSLLEYIGTDFLFPKWNMVSFGCCYCFCIDQKQSLKY